MMAQLSAMTLAQAVLLLTTVAMIGVLIVLIARGRGRRPPDEDR